MSNGQAVAFHSSPDTDLQQLVDALQPQSPLQRMATIFSRFAPEEILVTSSFAAHSVILLHALHRVAPGHPVYFIDTGYHFAQTLSYRKQLAEQFKINVIELRPDPERHRHLTRECAWANQPDRCCEVNKVEPLNRIKPMFKVWLSGLMHWQTPQRRAFTLAHWDQTLIKVYPFLDFTEAQAEAYLQAHDLPRHPLTQLGYQSIGCYHCTVPAAGREGRWPGTTKTECGLHR